MAGMLIKSRLLILSAAWSLIAGTVSFAEVSKESVLDNLKGQISKQYPGARIEINSEIKWTQGSAPSDFSAIQVTGDNQRGEIYFSVHNTENGNVSNGAAAFSAFVPTFTALRRVLPGERLSPEMFSVQDVNIATGQAREYRGVLLPKDTDLSRLEARLSILQGQFPLTTGVQKIPDVRRGESIRIKLIVGGVVLSTLGTAEEPAYIDKQVRITANKTKRQLVGTLKQGGIVEVKL